MISNMEVNEGVGEEGCASGGVGMAMRFEMDVLISNAQMEVLATLDVEKLISYSKIGKKDILPPIGEVERLKRLATFVRLGTGEH